VSSNVVSKLHWTVKITPLVASEAMRRVQIDRYRQQDAFERRASLPVEAYRGLWTEQIIALVWSAFIVRAVR